jgi:hypothetical protein
MRIPQISEGLLALRLLGPRLFVRKLSRLLYSKTRFLVLVKGLDHESPVSGNKVIVSPGSSEDVAKFFLLMSKESRESRYELLERKRFYEKGFHNCYIGRTIDSREMCGILWLATNRDIERTGSENYYPTLREDEILTENTYTLENFRGRGIMVDMPLQIEGIIREMGFKRWIRFPREDNLPSVRSCLKTGHLFLSQRILLCRFLFQTRKKVEHFDPPIPYSLHPETAKPK